MRDARRFVGTLAAMGLFAIAWQTIAWVSGPRLIQGPFAVAREAFGTLGYNSLLAAQPDLREARGLGIHVITTLRRMSYAIVFGFTVGIFVAIAAQSLKVVNSVIIGVLDLLRALPPLMFAPLTVFWIAPGDVSIVFAATTYSTATFALFGYAALKQADQRYGAMLAVLAEPVRRRYLSVLLPAAIPLLLNGFRISTGVVIGIVLVIEYFIGQVGLGRVLRVALPANDVGVMFAAILWSMIIVGAFDLVAIIGTRLLRPDLRHP